MEEADDINVRSGEPLFIEEIIDKVGVEDLNERAVCVIGRLSKYDSPNCEAILTDPQTSKNLCVNTALIEPLEAKKGSLYQMIGELEGNGNDVQGLVLRARVVRCVDRMDLVMYRKAIQCQRMYLAKRLG